MRELLQINSLKYVDQIAKPFKLPRHHIQSSPQQVKFLHETSEKNLGTKKPDVTIRERLVLD